VPFAGLSPAVAGAAFVGLSSGLLGFGLARTRSGLAKLPLFMSAPFCMAALLVQWAPLMMVGAVIPALQFLGAAKPNVAFACFAYRPTVRGVVLGAIFVAISIAILPSWPFDWRDALRERHAIARRSRTSAVRILLLAALRWRRAEARTLLAMAVMPQLTLFYDQLPLWLVPTTVWRSLLLSALSWVAWAQWYPNRRHCQRMSRSPAVGVRAHLRACTSAGACTSEISWARARSFARASPAIHVTHATLVPTATGATVRTAQPAGHDATTRATRSGTHPR
jgi:hypothetical protein